MSKPSRTSNVDRRTHGILRGRGSLTRLSIFRNIFGFAALRKRRFWWLELRRRPLRRCIGIVVRICVACNLRVIRRWLMLYRGLPMRCGRSIIGLRVRLMLLRSWCICNRSRMRRLIQGLRSCWWIRRWWWIIRARRWTLSKGLTTGAACSIPIACLCRVGRHGMLNVQTWTQSYFSIWICAVLPELVGRAV